MAPYKLHYLLFSQFRAKTGAGICCPSHCRMQIFLFCFCILVLRSV